MRIRFFCSVQKKETETQTSFLQRSDKQDASIVDRFRSQELKAILLRETYYMSPLTPALVDGCNARLGFYIAAVHSPRFDILTPPPEVFARSPNVIFEFFGDTFLIRPVDSEAPNVFRYQPHMFVVLECLETRVVGREFAKFLGRLKCSYESGFVIVKVIDHRPAAPVEHNIALEIGPEVVRHFVEKDMKKDDRMDDRRDRIIEALQREVHVIQWRRPVICTDPSPDVARVQSVIDFRKKMWVARRERTKESDVARPESPKKPEQRIMGERITQTRTKVEIPESLQQLFARFAAQNMAPP
jgi:hypothetical protein